MCNILFWSDLVFICHLLFEKKRQTPLYHVGINQLELSSNLRHQDDDFVLALAFDLYQTRLLTIDANIDLCKSLPFPIRSLLFISHPPRFYFDSVRGGLSLFVFGIFGYINVFFFSIRETVVDLPSNFLPRTAKSETPCLFTCFLFLR